MNENNKELKETPEGVSKRAKTVQEQLDNMPRAQRRKVLNKLRKKIKYGSKNKKARR